MKLHTTADHQRGLTPSGRDEAGSALWHWLAEIQTDEENTRQERGS